MYNRNTLLGVILREKPRAREILGRYGINCES